MDLIIPIACFLIAHGPNAVIGLAVVVSMLALLVVLVRMRQDHVRMQREARLRRKVAGLLLRWREDETWPKQ